MGVSKTININNNTGSAISISRARVFLDDGSGSTLQLDTNNGTNFPNSITISSSQIFFNAPNYGTGRVNVRLIINYNFIPSIDGCTKTQTFNFVETAFNNDPPIDEDPNIEQVLLTLRVNPVNGEGGTATLGGLYNLNQSTQITAIPRVGYVFSSWSENGLNFSSQNPTPIIMNKSRTITANFSKLENEPDIFEVTIKVEGENGGTGEILFEAVDDNNNFSTVVSFTPSPSNSSFTRTFNRSTDIRLTATPAGDSSSTGNTSFYSWEGDSISTNRIITSTVDSDLTFIAKFKKEGEETTVENKSLTVDVNHLEAESSLNNKIEIRNSSGSTIQTATLNNPVTINNIAPNTQYSLNVLTDSDWNFKNWSGNNSSNINPLQITVLENSTFTSNFEKKPTQTTTLRVTKLLRSTLNSIVGTISGFINGIDILNDTGSSEFNRIVDLNDNLDLDVSSNTDYEFVEWIDNNTGNIISSIRPLRLVLVSSTNVGAIFRLKPKVSLLIEKLEGDAIIEVTGDLIYSLPVGTLSDNRNLSVGSVITFSISTPQGKEINSILFNGVSQDVLATSITKTINSNSTLQVRYKDPIVLNPARVNLTITKYLFGSINGSSGNVFVKNSSILNYFIGSSVGTNITSVDFETTSNITIQPSLGRIVNSVFINGNNTPILGGNGGEVIISVDMNEEKNIDIYFN